MSSELRKSLESIQSLLSQAKSPSSIGASSNTGVNAATTSIGGPVGNGYSPGPQQMQDIFRRSNERPHQQQFENHRGSSVSFNLHPAVMSPTNNTDYNNVNTPVTQPYGSNTSVTSPSYNNNMDTPATQLAPHHPNYCGGTSSSSSLCNFTNSPFNHKEVRPFSSDEHGGVIGSPLSAFSEFKRPDGATGNETTDIHRSGGSTNASIGETAGKKGRETSLLVSPTNSTETPGTIRQVLASPFNLSQIRTSLAYGNASGRDPTPYHNNGRHRSPAEESGSSRESRSGMDPPAKSPFGGESFVKFQPAALHREEELSMIQESGSYESKYESKLDQSVTSEVTGLTLPRTPVWRSQGNATPLSTRSRASVITGITGGTVGSPSKMMRDSLAQLANQTASRLDAVWDKIGVHPDERQAQLSDLINMLSRVCDDRISEEEGLVEQFVKEIDKMKAEWERSCVALGMEKSDPVEKLRRDPSATELGGGSEGLSLQCEYEAIQVRLESVRAAIAAAKEDAVASQKRIFEAYKALNGDALNGHVAVGELDQWRDVETNLTEERREEFRAKALELEENVASRTRAVVSLMVECQDLIRELDIVSEHGENGSDDVKIMNGLQLQTHEGDESSLLHGHHGRSRKSDNYTIASLFESPTCLGIGKSALDRLTTRLAELNSEKRRRRSILGEMGQAIHSLWVMLRVPPEEQKAFTESIRGLSMETIHKGEMELNRLHELKTVMLGKLIRDQRKMIEELWEQTNASDAEKASFDAYFHIYDDDKLTDELLAKHEQYTANLNAKLEKMQPILDLIAKREAIVSERFDLEMLQKDPERLKGRFATKQLMKEEKMTRRVQKELPRITHTLETTLLEWYEENRPTSTKDQEADPTLGHFFYQGAPYLETMHTQEHDWKMRKECEEQERHRKREEERSSKQNNAFGSTYTKLPGRKWNPSIGSSASSTTGQGNDARPRSASNARAASNPRGGPPRPLADVSGTKGNVPRAASRSRNGDKPVAGGKTLPGYRAASAPRSRF